MIYISLPRLFAYKFKVAKTTQECVIALKRFFSWADQANLYPNIVENVKAVLNKILQSDVIGKREFVFVVSDGKIRFKNLREIARSNIEYLRA
ncbi:MAG: hypothetical protein Nk1A_1200 [Endomicrobiia bacterium]|nr:MAG: hypothetical protein Nk1A_1200 [Endomicrobiia bacterium]